MKSVTNKVNGLPGLAIVRELVSDLDELLGLDGNFWCVPAKERAISDEGPIRDLMHDLLVTAFGLEVEGL